MAVSYFEGVGAAEAFVLCHAVLLEPGLQRHYIVPHTRMKVMKVSYCCPNQMDLGVHLEAGGDGDHRPRKRHRGAPRLSTMRCRLSWVVVLIYK